MIAKPSPEPDIAPEPEAETIIVAGKVYRQVVEETPEISRAKLLQEMEHETTFRSPSTKTQYLSHGMDFLDWVNKHHLKWSDRTTVYKYIELLKKRKLSQSTIDYIIRGPIGCFFRIYDLKLPVKLPPVKHGNTIDIASRLSFTYDEIVQLIKTAKASGNPQWQNMVALASTYMLRAGEIRAIKPSDVHPIKKTVLIQTEKGGYLREHFVPPEIAPYIFSYKYPPIPRQQVFEIFNEIAKAAGVSQVTDSGRSKGWHAIRHGVKTVMDGMRDDHDIHVFDKTDTFRFGRWKSSNMGEAYVTPDFIKEDKIIFKNHPFLKYWAEE